MPFGGGAFTDLELFDAYTEPHIYVTNAFRRGGLHGPYCSLTKRLTENTSPMPFGGGAFTDTETKKETKSMQTVTNAFRRGGLHGPLT